MHINNLPTLVLSGIFEQIFCDSFFVCSGWKSDTRNKRIKWAGMFALLHVCRSWRQVALPVAHRSTYISCSTPMDVQELSCIKTKLDIIPGNMTMLSPACLCIHVEYHKNIVMGLQLLLETMRRNADCLTDIRKLIITIEINDNGMDSIFGRITNPEEVSCLGNAVCRLLPALTRISYRQAWWNYMVLRPLLTGIARERWSRLKSVDCANPIVLPCLIGSGKLEKLVVEFDSEASVIPSIYTDNLRYLCIGSVCENFPWKNFNDSQSQRSLYFPRLKYMKVNNYPPPPNHYARFRDKLSISELIRCYFGSTCVMPQLLHLQLSATPRILSILCAISEPEIIPYVSIQARPVVTLVLKDLSTSYVSQHLPDAINDEMSMMEILSSILSVSNLSRASRAVINVSHRNIDIEDWTYLDKIQLKYPIELDPLVVWISKMQNVVALTINWLVTDRNEDGTVFVPSVQLSLNSNRCSIPSTLSTMVVHIQDPACPESIKADIAGFLNDKFPSLKRLEIE